MYMHTYTRFIGFIDTKGPKECQGNVPHTLNQQPGLLGDRVDEMEPDNVFLGLYCPVVALLWELWPDFPVPS